MNFRFARPEKHRCFYHLMRLFQHLYLPSLLLHFLLQAVTVQAQTYSYDGQRWYEAEVSIFTHEPVPELFPEIRNLENMTLTYPQRTRILRTTSASLELPEDMFDPPVVPFRMTGPSESEAPAIVIGPKYSPGTTNPVIQDVDRDAFTRIGNEGATFNRHNSRLRNASDHRLLFHAVWRFPVRDEAETTFVAVNGGGFYSPHYELEGYLGFSLSGNRIDLQTDLWLMDFMPATGRASDADVIQVPFSPHALETDGNGLILEPQTAFLVQDIWQLKELRPMISRQLHYLDHPRLGVIAEVRPYLLPDSSPTSE